MFVTHRGAGRLAGMVGEVLLFPGLLGGLCVCEGGREGLTQWGMGR